VSKVTSADSHTLY